MMPVGFVALWNNNQAEYTASPRDEWGTTEAIQAAFARGRARGNRTYGLYFCRWSSAWQYLTFWVSPSIEAVFDTIADLERAGDFKFADSWHICGRFIADRGCLSAGAWDVIPEPVAGEPTPFGIVLMERGPGANRADREHELSAIAASSGVRLYGAFDCRLSSGWDRFTVATATDAARLADYLGWLERASAFRGVETFAVSGRLDRYFRFGNHLQTSLTWLNEEDAGP